MSDQSPADRPPKLPAEPPPALGQLPAGQFVAVKSHVMKGSVQVAVARSQTMAKRIANALNRHQPNREGV